MKKIILGIDTSCDDTAVAVLQVKSQKSKVKRFKVLSNVVSSQIKIHRKYGGVYPMMAKREHQRNLTFVLKKALKKSNCLNSKLKIQNSKFQAKIQKLKEILQRDVILQKHLISFLKKYQKPRLCQDFDGQARLQPANICEVVAGSNCGQAKIDAIAVTVGPGLEPCLWQGINFAKALAFWWNIPIIPVNHIEAHLLAFLINQNQKDKQNSKLKTRNSKQQLKAKILKNKIEFPLIGLVASGGHTQLILVKKIGKYKIIGETRDDAAGECFDKTARILGLGYPGGPAIAKIASQWNLKLKTKNSKLQLKTENLKMKLPRPMLNSDNFDFSFSGLKTAVLYTEQKKSAKIKKEKEYLILMAKEIQQAIIDVLIKKTLRAAKTFNVKTIILAGGVAANDELRSQLQDNSSKCGINFWVAPKNLCTDNGAMTAIAGYFNLNKKKAWKNIRAKANLRI